MGNVGIDYRCHLFLNGFIVSALITCKCCLFNALLAELSGNLISDYYYWRKRDEIMCKPLSEGCISWAMWIS